jgi:hypothetical protein
MEKTLPEMLLHFKVTPFRSQILGKLLMCRERKDVTLILSEILGRQISLLFQVALR